MGQKEGRSLFQKYLYLLLLLIRSSWLRGTSGRGGKEEKRGQRRRGREGRKDDLKFFCVSGHMMSPHVASKFWVPYETQV